MLPAQSTRTRRSASGAAQAPGMPARASSSRRARAVSGDGASSARAPGAAMANAARTSRQARAWASARAVRDGTTMSAQRIGLADLDDVHLGEGVGAEVMDRAPFLGAQDAARHPIELLAGDVEQHCSSDPEREAASHDHIARLLEP